MSVLWVPYHLDEHLPGLGLPLAPDEVVTAELPAADVWTRLTVLYSMVARPVADEAGRGTRPAVVSGDCTTALGTVAGLQRAGVDPGIVWLDAHGDVQTMETTASGYLGGLPLRLLTGYRPELITARLGLRPVPEQRVMLVGARDLDPPEIVYLAGALIRRRDVASLDPRHLPDGPLYVHLDLDVMDPAEIPGLRYPAPGGPGPAEIADALRMLLRTGRVAAVGIACTWYPGSTAAACISPYLESAFAGPD
ncbi:MAG TPA: arginase family protein [Streptosporangiaceae bacterium]|nr:arginase family protein [Streptosporangiaceae bacterium]